MLGRFIAPAAGLDKLAAARAAGSGVWSFAVLVGDRAGPEAALETLHRQGRQVWAVWPPPGIPPGRRPGMSPAGRRLPLRPGPRALPGRSIADPQAVGLGGRELFLELPAGGDDRLALDVLAEIRAGRPDPEICTELGAKLRCGGLVPEAFPAVERVAAVLAGSARRQIPLKFTAGLHHPVRRRAADPDVMMYGFFNVFGAAFLAHAAGLAEAELAACLAETDPGAFTFTDEAFLWRGHGVGAARLAALRGAALCGFGSCSFAEPVDGLKSSVCFNTGDSMDQIDDPWRSRSCRSPPIRIFRCRICPTACSARAAMIPRALERASATWCWT